MNRKTIYMLAAAMGIAVASLPNTALAAGPGFPGSRPFLNSGVELAEFWGEPFPYGYRWRRHPECMRDVTYQDHWSGVTYWRRVWVCECPYGACR
jgi:hypothetical protein